MPTDIFAPNGGYCVIMRSGKLGFRVARIWYVTQLVTHINCWLIYNPGEYESPKRALIIKMHCAGAMN